MAYIMLGRTGNLGRCHFGGRKTGVTKKRRTVHGLDFGMGDARVAVLVVGSAGSDVHLAGR